MSSSYNALEEERGGGVEEYATECDIFNFVKVKELKLFENPKIVLSRA